MAEKARSLCFKKIINSIFSNVQRDVRLGCFLKGTVENNNSRKDECNAARVTC